MDKNKIWLDLIIELQSLAQAGLTYGKIFMIKSDMNGYVKFRQK